VLVTRRSQLRLVGSFTCGGAAGQCLRMLA